MFTALLLILGAGQPSVLASKLVALECRDSSALRELLVGELAFSAQLPKPVHAPSYWKGVKIGCARAMSSSYGQVRVWTAYPPAGLLTDREVPVGYLTWKDPSGRVRIYKGDESVDGLHLGGIIDGVYKLKRSERYLITGLTHGLRVSVRRFAYVLSLTGDRPSKVKGAFRLQGRPRDELLLKGQGAQTEKFRHHELALYWLRYYPTGGELVLEAINGEPGYRQNPPRTAAVLQGGVFEIAKNKRMNRMILMKR